MTNVIDDSKFTHAVTFRVERYRRTDTFSPTYFYKWMLVASCEECGWSHYTVRNADLSGDCSITQDDRYEAVMHHTYGEGIFRSGGRSVYRFRDGSEHPLKI